MSKTFSQKYAPTSIDEVILSGDAIKFKDPSFDLKTSPNLLFVGQPGCGKTTLAKILAKDYDYIYINASDESGVDVIRNKVTDFIKAASMFDEVKVVILDEADGLSSITGGNGSSAQQALRGIIEENLEHCKFILTANYSHKIIDALQSRCQTYNFKLTTKDVAARIAHIVREEKIKFEKEDLMALIKTYAPDLRKCINELQRGLNAENVFKFNKTISLEIPAKIKKCIEGKINVFDIRASIINDEDSFQGDYLILMRGLFDLYCEARDANAVKAVCYHMEKHPIVMDKEVNFTSLLLNLSKV
jgi:replication factor C small subunit